MSNKILVTGATGFVGSALVERLLSQKHEVVALVRQRNAIVAPQVQISVMPEQGTDLSSVRFDDVAAVVHCAARVHVMNDTSVDPLAEFRAVNVDLTLDLARRAAAAGVRRFIFVSSIKVNGEATAPGSSFKSDDVPAPLDPYGISKMEAEQGLLRVSQETGIEIVIIRPVLIYGPGVKANFRSMMSWLDKGIPLPFGAIRNKRSLVSLDNLVDLIMTCLDHPAAANQTFMVSDGEDVSTTELLSRMAAALGKPARLIPVPAALMNIAAKILGRADIAQRLNGSLQVDISKTREVLGWSPIKSLDEGLAKTANDFRTKSKSV